MSQVILQVPEPLGEEKNLRAAEIQLGKAFEIELCCCWLKNIIKVLEDLAVPG